MGRKHTIFLARLIYCALAGTFILWAIHSIPANVWNVLFRQAGIPVEFIYSSGLWHRGSAFVGYKNSLNEWVLFPKAIEWHLSWGNTQYPVVFHVNDWNIGLGIHGYQVSSKVTHIPLVWSQSAGSPLNSIGLQGNILIEPMSMERSWADKSIPKMTVQFQQVSSALAQDTLLGSYSWQLPSGEITTGAGAILNVSGYLRPDAMHLSLKVTPEYQKTLTPMLNMLAPLRSDQSIVLNAKF